MDSGKMSERVLLARTAAIILAFLFVIPGISALGTDRQAQLIADKGGETFIVFDGATMEDFSAVVDLIESSGGSAYARNPPNTIRATLPAGTGAKVMEMTGVSSAHTGPVNMKVVRTMNKDVQIGAGAWNLFLAQMSSARSTTGPMSGKPVTSISDRSVPSNPFTDHHIHDGMAELYNDAIVCDDDLFCTADPVKAKDIQARSRLSQMGYSPMGPMPGPQDTTEFLLGSVGVAIVFPESNGSIDANQETWTGAEETNVINEITGTFTWWVARKTAEGITVPLSFSYKTYYKQATSYEPITRNGFTGAANQNMWTWMNEIQGNLGYGQGNAGTRAFANATRYQLGTDWAYITWVADDTVDGNNQFADGTFGFAGLGGPEVVMTYDNDGYTIASMDAVFAHETGHIFFANDEYSGSGADSGDRTGYENVLNGNAIDVGSPGPITNVQCIMRGGAGPYGTPAVCGFTKGMIGWNDTDADHIPNVVDTYPNTTLDPMPNKMINKTTYTYFGNASEVPAQNNNPWGAGNDVTINRLTAVDYRLDSGSWSTVTALDGAISNQSEKFKIILSGLTEGSHFVEVRATNNRGNVEPLFANETFFVDTTTPSTQVEPLPQYESATSFKINWTGTDGAGSGLKNMELFYRKDGGNWLKYQNKFTKSPITFGHTGDGFYEFYSRGFDNASNWELAPATPDAFTTVEGTAPTSSAGPLPAFTNQTVFDVPFVAEDLGVGLDLVTLFYRLDMGQWTEFGNSSTSPMQFTSIGDGKYDFYTIGMDLLANTEYKIPKSEATIVVDTVTPITNLNLVGQAAENGWYTSAVGVTMYTSEAAKNLDYTMFRLDSGNWTKYTGTFNVPGDGITVLEYYSADLAENVELVKSLTLKVDKTAPTGTIVLNGGKVQTNSTTVDVALSAQDNGAPVTDMKVTEDSSFSAAQWVNFTSHMTYTLTTIAGEKFIYAMFKNQAGLVSDVVSSSVIMDNADPTIKITKPIDKAALATFDFEVRGTAEDNVGIAKVEVSIDDGVTWTEANGTTVWDVIVRSNGNGFYNITARVFDKVGNTASTKIRIEIDATLPTVTLDTPKDNAATEAKVIPVSGTTDPRAVVKVNGAMVPVDKDGNFKTSVSLKDGLNTIVITIQKPAGTIEKKIRVTYIHAPIIISDLKHRPTDPTPQDNVTITCTVPGNHIKSVELRYKLFGMSEQTATMKRGANDGYSATIGPFIDGTAVEYYVSASDDVGVKAKYPETGKRNFTVHGVAPPPVLPPEPVKEDMSLYGYIFLFIVFAIMAVLIGLSMRSPKDPHAPKKVSGKTAVEHIDDRADDGNEGSGFREDGRRGGGGGGGGYDRVDRPPESDRYDAGGGYTRHRDDNY